MFYLMIKPPPPLAGHIAAVHGPIDRAELLHVTLQPLGDRAELDGAALDRLRRVVDGFDGRAFRVNFDRLRDSGRTVSLRGSDKIRGALRFQHALVRTLAGHGFALPYTFRPHLTLRYRGTAPGEWAIDPIGWMAEELLLVESIDGRHEPFGRWSLPA